MINQYGGKMKDAIGVPEEQLRQAARSAVCKINIDTDGRMVMTATIRKVFAESPRSSTRASTSARPGRPSSRCTRRKTARSSARRDGTDRKPEAGGYFLPGR